MPATADYYGAAANDLYTVPSAYPAGWQGTDVAESGVKGQASWQTDYYKGQADLARQAGLDDAAIIAANPINGTNATDITSQMNRRQAALSKRNSMLARQTSDFNDAMGKSFGSWHPGSDNYVDQGPPLATAQTWKPTPPAAPKKQIFAPMVALPRSLV